MAERMAVLVKSIVFFAVEDREMKTIAIDSDEKERLK